MTTIQVMRKALEALNRLYLAAPTSLECRTFHHSKSEQHRHDEECKPAMEYVQAVGAAASAITALRAELERLEAVEPYTWYDDSTGETYTAGAIADGVRLAEELRPLYTAPIAPAIPALTIEEVSEGAPGFSDVPKYGPAYLAGAHWAYTLAAARIGARIVKAAPIVPTIPALTDEEISAQYPVGLTFADDMRWAYSLAAERAGVQIKEEK